MGLFVADRPSASVDACFCRRPYDTSFGRTRINEPAGGATGFVTRRRTAPRDNNSVGLFAGQTWPAPQFTQKTPSPGPTAGFFEPTGRRRVPDNGAKPCARISPRASHRRTRPRRRADSCQHESRYGWRGFGEDCSSQANFSELRHDEVRRTRLPRTRVTRGRNRCALAASRLAFPAEERLYFVDERQ